MSQTFLVTGATGHQGGHTARLLLAANQKVHALVRDPAAPKAVELKNLGAEIFPGDFASPDSIFAAAQGCSSVFINVSPVFNDPLGERTHVHNILSACHKAGVKRIVQSSVTLSDKPEKEALVDFDENSWMATYFASKHACEAAVKEAEGFDSWTILRPGRLLNTYVAPVTGFMFPALKEKGLIRTALREDLKQQVLDPIEVGRAAVMVFLDTEGRFEKRTISLAAKLMTMGEIAGAMNAALGEERVKVEYIGAEEAKELEKTNPIVGSEVFLNKNAELLRVDLKEVRKLGICEEDSVNEFFPREIQALKSAVGL